MVALSLYNDKDKVFFLTDYKSNFIRNECWHLSFYKTQLGQLEWEAGALIFIALEKLFGPHSPPPPPPPSVQILRIDVSQWPVLYFAENNYSPLVQNKQIRSW